MYVATVQGQLAGFISVMHFPHWHAKSKNIKKVHRLVVLPDFQGIGLSAHLLQFAADTYTAQGFRLIILTSSPALSFSLKKNPRWRCARFGRVQSTTVSGCTKESPLKVNTTLTSNSAGRVTATWEYNLTPS